MYFYNPPLRSHASIVQKEIRVLEAFQGGNGLIRLAIRTLHHLNSR